MSKLTAPPPFFFFKEAQGQPLQIENVDQFLCSITSDPTKVYLSESLEII